MKHITPLAPRGSIALISLVYLAIFAVLATALIHNSLGYRAWQKNELVRTQALYLAEGGLSYAVYALNQNPQYAGETNTPLGNGVFSIAVTSLDTATREVVVTGRVLEAGSPVATRTIRAQVGIAPSIISFNYGVQAGAGGVTLSDAAHIQGNVFSGGSVTGDNNNDIEGDVVSLNAVQGVNVSGSVNAHTTGGAVSFPVSDAQIVAWKDEAVAGSTLGTCVGGTLTIATSMTIGPAQVPCDLHIEGAETVVTIAGHVWVEGNMTTQSGTTIAIDPALGDKNVAIVAGNPSNTSGSGIISIGQGTKFQGSGNPQSFVFLASENTSASVGGGTVAISLAQSALPVVAFAAKGLVALAQNVTVRAVVAYQVSLSQSAAVIYDSGLSHALFHTGPQGSFGVVSGTYSLQ